MDVKLSDYSGVETSMLVSMEGEAPADLSSEALAKAEPRRTGRSTGSGSRVEPRERSALHEFPQELAGQGTFS